MTKPAKFHLMRYFAIASLAAISAVTISIGRITWQLGDEQVREQEERLSAAYAQALTRFTGETLSEYLKVARTESINALANHDVSKKLYNEIAHVSRLHPVLRLDIMDINGVTVASTFTDDMNRNQSASIAFQTALSGEAVHVLQFHETFRLQRDVQFRDRHVFESYMPLRLQSNGTVEGVLTIYRDATPSLQQLRRSRIEFGITLISGAAALYVILMLAILRASRILRTAEENIRFHAYHDTLTGLPNRVTFQERVGQAILRAKRSKKPFGVMFLDLDRFKGINDSLGHDVGDEILKSAARRIQMAVRETDLVFRMGGDEFTVLLEQLDAPESAATVARRINTSMSVPTRVGDHEAGMMASVGIAVYPGDGETVEDLLKAADTAMYGAKELGGNQYHFYTHNMNRAAQVRWELESALHRAVNERQFLLYYQPKIACDSREVVGIEALLRWQHPTRGILPPTEFLPFLEQSGLIVPVGEWVVREACRQTKFWQENGVPLFRVSVNISARQFRADGFVEFVANELIATQLNPSFLEFELTESVLLDNPRAAIRKMQELKALGVTLSIDDFGSGYSSLNYLKHFPVDYLKVDKSFIAGLHTNTRDNAITLAIAGLARSLNLSIVAEGVETAEQVKLLKTQGYTELQGFLFAKPMEPSAIPSFVMTTQSNAVVEKSIEGA